MSVPPYVKYQDVIVILMELVSYAFVHCSFSYKQSCVYY